MTNEVSLEGVIKTFSGNVALKNVSVEFHGGEVHTIMGENGAGKSTLLNILSGTIRPDEGVIRINGKEYRFNGPLEARHAGVSIVRQELSTFPHMTVGENILVGRLPQKVGMLDKRALEQKVDLYLKFFEVPFGAHTSLKSLSISEQQIVEIIRGVMIEGAHTFIFDEPTSSLGTSDVHKVFELIRKLRSEGKIVIYVSHKFDEMFEISDRISVLRDGALVGSDEVSAFTTDSIINLMVGRAIENIYPPRAKSTGETLLEVTGLNLGTKCKDVSFELRRGEIYGLFGLVGSGRTEIARALVGADGRRTGDVTLNGHKVRINSIQDSIQSGIFYLTEDRKVDGLFVKMSVAENIAVTDLDAVAKGGMIRSTVLKSVAMKAIQRLRVKTSSISQPVRSLSGGNQQKVMILKWLQKQPKILILDEPTRGIDVGAKAEIHELLRRLATDGVGVIVISSELPEVIGLSDRVGVVYNGSIVCTLEGEDITEDGIMFHASGLGQDRKLG